MWNSCISMGPQFFIATQGGIYTQTLKMKNKINGHFKKMQNEIQT